MYRSYARLLSICTLLIAGCNGNSTNGVGGGGGTGDDGMMPADQPDMADPSAPPDMSLPKRAPTDHPPLPTMDDNGGPTLKAPEVWTVVWKGDEALGEQTNAFINWMVQSDTYWTAGTSEYGVGKGRGMGFIVLPDAMPATIDDGQLKMTIKKHIADGLFPMPNENTVISYVIPEKTMQTMGGAQGCKQYGGYHAETLTAMGSKTYVSYAVNLQCAGFGGGTLFDSLTEVISHEIAEVATDPHPFTNPGYSASSAPLGGEDGDLCNPLAIKLPAVIGHADAGTTNETYLVSRVWSNQNARAGNADPCLPAPATPYFNVAVDPTDIRMKAPAANAASTTFEGKIEPYAFGDVGAITWTARAPGKGITVTPTTGTASAGDTILMTVTVDTTAQTGTFPIILRNKSAQGGKNIWVSSLTIN